MIEAVPVTPAGQDFVYDVFVSYRQRDPDGSWVRGQLVPRLRTAGLRVCLDGDSFRLGAPLVLEMGRAVESSRYTLLVLTPAYLESAFTELESVLAEHLGLEQRETRMLIVLREAAHPRVGLRARLWLDMTHDEEVDDQVARLVSAIRSQKRPGRGSRDGV
jgi:hypothetical protein